MIVIMLGVDLFIGCMLIGCVEIGILKIGDMFKVFSCDGIKIEQFCVIKIMVFCGFVQVLIDEVVVGDIVLIVGMLIVIVVDILCDLLIDIVLFVQLIDLFIILVLFGINDSLLVGCDGKKVQLCVICDCLMKEVEINVVIKIEDILGGEVFIVLGCGEL